MLQDFWKNLPDFGYHKKTMTQGFMYDNSPWP